MKGRAGVQAAKLSASAAQVEDEQTVDGPLCVASENIL